MTRTWIESVDWDDEDEDWDDEVDWGDEEDAEVSLALKPQTLCLWDALVEELGRQRFGRA